MSALLYYIIIYPLSLLPYGVLYRISDLLYLITYHLFSYRKEVVISNLRNSFPEKTEIEITEISKKFYKHFCDIILETIKTFTLSEKKALEIMTVVNPEGTDKYYDQGKDILIVGGHYANWEAFTYSAKQHKHILSALFTPLSNKFFNKKMKSSREKFGMFLYPTNKYKEFMAMEHEKPNAYIYSIDQSPRKDSGYWMTFLNQETAVLFGAEKVSKKHNLPVVFGATRKISRGKFSIEYETLIENPSEYKYGEITEIITKRMEELILEAPEYWLWTHKRWKHKRKEYDNE